MSDRPPRTESFECVCETCGGEVLFRGELLAAVRVGNAHELAKLRSEQVEHKTRRVKLPEKGLSAGWRKRKCACCGEPVLWPHNYRRPRCDRCRRYCVRNIHVAAAPGITPGGT